MILLVVFLWLQAEHASIVGPVTVCEALRNVAAYKSTPVAVVGRLERSVSLQDSTEYLDQEDCGAGTATRILLWEDPAPEDGPEPPKDHPNLDQPVLVVKLAQIRKTTALGTHREPVYKKVQDRVIFSHFADVPNSWAVAYGRLVKIPEEGWDGVVFSLFVVRQNIRPLTGDGRLGQTN